MEVKKNVKIIGKRKLIAFFFCASMLAGLVAFDRIESKDFANVMQSLVMLFFGANAGVALANKLPEAVRAYKGTVESLND